MTKNLYLLNSSVDVIKFKMNQFLEKWGLISKMAEAAGCQRSHLSRVIAGEAQLTLEQAEALCHFFEFVEMESDFFLTLVQFERAGTKTLKARLQKKISGIRQSQEDLSKRLNIPSIGMSEHELIYYSSWHWVAIHILVSIPEFQTVSAISKRLSLEEATVHHSLQILENFGFVKKQGGRWVFASQSIHLPKNSPFVGIHHQNWRAKSTQAVQNPADDGVHYTVVQSLSREDYQRVKHLVLSMIDEFQSVAGPSKEEELVCFTCDVFRV